MATHPLINPTTFPFDAALLPQDGEYVSVFENAHAEQMFFVQTPGVPTARLLHTGLSALPVPVAGGLAPGWLLDRDEVCFLATAWKASQLLRLSRTQPDTWRAALAAEPRVNLYIEPVAAYARCGNCGEAIGRHANGTWFHSDADGMLCDRGCRAMSYRATGEYNPTFQKKWSAEP